MSTLEGAVILVSCLQPALLGVLVWVGGGRWLGSLAPTAPLSAPRSRGADLRLFECATSGRLTSTVEFGINTLALCMAFLLYDVDVFFFLPAAAHLATSSGPELGLLGFWLFFFGAGL